MATVLEASQLAFEIERWIAEARSGSPAALERLLESCSRYLLAIAQQELCVAVRSRFDPGDVVQETLMKAWRHFPSFRGETRAEWLAWLRQILRHTLANLHRQHIQMAVRSIQREVPLAKAAAMARAEDADRDLPDKQAQAQEQHEVLEGALQRLPQRYRQILELHTQEKMTFAQVGERLHCSAEAARKLWRRAAEKLARLLGDAWEA